MNRNRLVRNFLLPLPFIMISACAKVGAPTGGPRDRTPPVVMESIPVAGAKNFRDKRLEITFDEYVTLDNINENLLVSPPFKKKPKVYIRGKSIIAELEEKLKDSTTYTFNFQDAIKDLNEGNILDNYQFVFSTGPVIDSLSVTGNVYNAFDLEPPEKTQVLLYSSLADTSVTKHIPDYISRVDKNGYFRINNVPAGIFRLYALKDADNSKNYNLPDEEFAFINSPIEITPEKNYLPVVKDTIVLKKGAKKIADTTIYIGEYQLYLFTGLKKAHYLTSSGRPSRYEMIFTLSLPPDSMKFEISIPGTHKDAWLIEKNKEKDTIKVWLTDSTLYSQTLIKTMVTYPFTDTLGNLRYKKDTIPMRFMAPRPSRVQRVTRPKFKFEALPANTLKPGQQITFTSETPFRQPDTTLIKLYELMDKDRKRIPYVLTRDSSNSCRYSLKANFTEGNKYLFVAYPASFGSIYNEICDSTGILLSVKNADSYSKLTFNIRNYEGDRIIQLLNSSEKVINETIMKKDGKIDYPLLENGLYRVRVIYDLNGDGKWTTGDFTTGRQPEPVSYYPEEIDLKTGWEAEQDWDIGIKDFKDQKLRQKKKK